MPIGFCAHLHVQRAGIFSSSEILELYSFWVTYDSLFSISYMNAFDIAFTSLHSSHGKENQQ